MYDTNTVLDSEALPPADSPERRLDLALWMVEQRGFSVIALKAGAKIPVAPWNAFQRARPSRRNLMSWFAGGGNHNLGLVCGTISGVVAVDLDSPAAIAWADAHLPPTPMGTRTAKGQHRFYRWREGLDLGNHVRIDVGDPDVRIDIRTDGGYVVAPGSTHESGHVYTRIGSWPPTEQLPRFDPSWFASSGPSSSVRPDSERPAEGVDGEPPSATPLELAGIAAPLARRYLEAVPPAVEGEGGDTRTFGVCCALVRGFNLTDEQALEVLRAWNLRCVPPWSDAELGSKLDGARKYGEEPFGGRLPKLSVEDFYAYMPGHAYLFLPTMEFWPAASVNGRLPLVGEERPSQWLDRNRPVEQMTWCPGLPQTIHGRVVAEGGWIERSDCTTLNRYRPPRIELGNPKLAGPWLDHVARVYPGDVEHIVRWLAHRVQHPDVKVNHALVLSGGQGIGKDSLLEPVKQAVGPWNFVEVGPSQLLGRFNGFVKSVILRVNEAHDLGDFDRFAFYDHMKVYTASPPDVLRVDEKNLREYAVFNLVGVIVTTNHRTDGLYLPPDDRRHYVAWSDGTKDVSGPTYWTDLWRWYASGGAGHVAAYLSTVDLQDFDPKAPPPKTPAFWDIVDANRAQEDAELADALDALARPNAVALDDIRDRATYGLKEWLQDRRSYRQVPHRLEAVGYVPVRNPDAGDGLWRFGGRRQVIYARQDLSQRERLMAGRERSSLTTVGVGRNQCSQ